MRRDGRRIRPYGFGSSPGAGLARCREDWAHLLRLLDQGRLSPMEHATLPFEDVAKAHELLDAGKARGKIVLSMGAS
jgi:NADPH:quinone reductase-like Zn-dependent oxidoreductase